MTLAALFLLPSATWADTETWDFTNLDNNSGQISSGATTINVNSQNLYSLSSGEKIFGNRFAIGPSERTGTSGFYFKNYNTEKGLYSQYDNRNFAIRDLKNGDKITIVWTAGGTGGSLKFSGTPSLTGNNLTDAAVTSNNEYTASAGCNLLMVTAKESADPNIYISSVTIKTAEDNKPTIQQTAGTNIVTITAKSGFTTYYTLDGNDPTTSSESFETTKTLVLGDNCTVKAYSVKDSVTGGTIVTDVASLSYTRPTATAYGKYDFTALVNSSTTRVLAENPTASINGNYYLKSTTDNVFDYRFTVGPTNRQDSGNGLTGNINGWVFEYKDATYKGLFAQYDNRKFSIIDLKDGDMYVITTSNNQGTLGIESGKLYTKSGNGNVDLTTTGSVYVESVVIGNTSSSVYHTITEYSANGNTVTAKAGALETEKVTVTITSASGYAYTDQSLTIKNGDANVSYTSNGDGTYTFVMPAGNVSLSASFTSTTTSITGATVTLDKESFSYTGEAQKPTVSSVGLNQTTLSSETDYDVIVEEQTAIGNYTLTVIGKGSYSGTVVKNWSIGRGAGSVSYATAEITKTVGDAAFTNELTKVGDGTVTYSISDGGTDTTINTSTGEVTVGSTAGTATITATVTNGTNYDYATNTATYTLTVNAAEEATAVTAWTSWTSQEGNGDITSLTTNNGMYLRGNNDHKIQVKDFNGAYAGGEIGGKQIAATTKVYQITRNTSLNPSTADAASTVTDATAGALALKLGTEGKLYLAVSNPNSNIPKPEIFVNGTKSEFSYDSWAQNEYKTIEIEISSNPSTVFIGSQSVGYDYRVAAIVFSPKHTISKGTDSGANGTISVAGTAYAGEKVEVTVSPNSGYKLDKLTVGENEITADSEGKYIFTMPDANVSLSASFTSTTTSIAEATVTLDKESFSYTGKAQKPTVSSVGLNQTTLSSETDYDVIVEEQTAIGNYTLTVIGKGSYSGTVVKNWSIGRGAGSVSYATAEITKTVGDAAFTNELTKVGDGTVTYSISDGGTDTTINTSTGEVTVGSTAGTATVTATVTNGTNYDYATTTATYTLTVNAKPAEDAISTMKTWTFNNYNVGDYYVSNSNSYKAEDGLYVRSLSGRNFVITESTLNYTFSDGTSGSVTKYAKISGTYSGSNSAVTSAAQNSGYLTPFFAFNTTVAGTCYAYVKSSGENNQNVRIYYTSGNGSFDCPSGAYTTSNTAREIKLKASAGGSFFIGSTTNAVGEIYAIRFVPTHTLTSEVDPTGKATITMKDGSTAVDSGTSIEEGKTITIEVSGIANGYEIDHVKVNDGDALTATNGKYSFTMPTADATVKVTLKKKSYTLTAATVDNGSISFTVSGAAATTAEFGDEVTIISNPNANYQLSTLTGTYGTESTALSITDNKFTMPDGDVTITATFVSTAVVPTTFDYGTFDFKQFVIDNSLENGTKPTWGATIDGADVQTLTYKSGNIIATFGNRFAAGPVNQNSADNCFKFRNDNGNQYTGLYSQYADRTLSILGLIVGDRITFTFAAAGTTLTYGENVSVVNNQTITVTEAGRMDFKAAAGVVITSVKIEAPITMYNVAISGNIENGTVNADKTTAEEGETVTLTVTPEEGYVVESLTVKDADNGDVTVTTVAANSSYTFVMPAKAVTITVAFTQYVEKTVNSVTNWTFDGLSGTCNEIKEVNGAYLRGSASNPTRTFTVKDINEQTLTFADGTSVTVNKYLAVNNSMYPLAFTETSTAASTATKTNNNNAEELIGAGSFAVNTTMPGTIYAKLSTESDQNVRIYCTDAISSPQTFALKAADGIQEVTYTTTAENGGTFFVGGVGGKYNIYAVRFVPTSQAVTYTLTVGSVENGTITAKIGDTTVAEGESAQVIPGSTVTLTAVPADGYQLSGWKNGSNDLGAIPQSIATTAAMPATALTVSAAFEQQPSSVTAVTVAKTWDFESYTTGISLSGSTVYAATDGLYISGHNESAPAQVVAGSATGKLGESDVTATKCLYINGAQNGDLSSKSVNSYNQHAIGLKVGATGILYTLISGATKDGEDRYFNIYVNGVKSQTKITGTEPVVVSQAVTSADASVFISVSGGYVKLYAARFEPATVETVKIDDASEFSAVISGNEASVASVSIDEETSVITISGSVDGKDVTSIADNVFTAENTANVGAIDLSETKINLTGERGEIPALKNINSATLVYVPSTASVTGTNVVTSSGACTDYQVFDSQLSNGKPCEVPKTFTADKATLNRTFTASQKCTVCLPYSFARTGGKFYKFVGISGGKVQMAEQTTDMLEANTPYIFEPSANADGITTNTGTIAVSISDAPNTEVSSASFTFKGTYEKIEWTNPTGIYGFAAEDKDGATVGSFVRVGTGASIMACRAYLEYTGTAPINGVAATRGMTDSLPATLEIEWIPAEKGSTTGINRTELQNDDDAPVYSITGQRVDSSYKGLVIKNGKKVVRK